METTVVKALKVLEALSVFDGPAPLTEIARQCGLTKSNAHRLLKTLVQHQYVLQHEPSKAYELTLRLWELGVPVYDRLDLRAVAAPELIKLAKATNESVHLSVLEGGMAVYVDKVDCTHAVRAYIRIGERAPAYCVATGKAMLAFQPRAVVDRACRRMRRFTDVTVKNRKALDAELARIRERGHAMTFGEWREGVIGIAAPIRDRSGAVSAGIGIAGPADRMRKADLDRMVGAVRRAAEQISAGLGASVHVRPPVETQPTIRRRASSHSGR
jgi:DNA-binding IclR family transcriptional regulator